VQIDTEDLRNYSVDGLLDALSSLTGSRIRVSEFAGLRDGVYCSTRRVDIFNAHLLLHTQAACFDALRYLYRRHLMLDGKLLCRRASSVLTVEAKIREVQNELIMKRHTNMWA